MKIRFLALALAALLPVGAHAQVSAVLPTTCNPNAPGDCVRATPVVNPDGTTIGASGSSTQQVQGLNANNTTATGNPLQLGIVDDATGNIRQLNGGAPSATGLTPGRSANVRSFSYVYDGVNGLWRQALGDANGLPFVTGNVASGTADSGNPVKTGGYASSSIPTAVTVGQRVNGWYTLNGATVTAPSLTFAPADGLANSGSAPMTTAGYQVPQVNFSQVFNGTTWDRQRGDTTGTYMVPQPVATASAGIAPATVASANSQVAKASAGNMYGLNVDNAAVTGTYAVLYNATAAPTAGASLTASLILWSFLLGSGASLDKSWPVPVNCTVGCTVIYTTSLTTFTAPATAPLVSTVMVK